METDNALSVQNAFFNQVRKDKTRVSILLNNGQRIAGVIKSFDKFTFLLDTRHGDQMIFKHAVSAVALFKAQEGARPQRHPAEAQASADDAAVANAATGPVADAAPEAATAAPAATAADRPKRGGRQENRFGNFIKFDDAQGTGKT